MSYFGHKYSSHKVKPGIGLYEFIQGLYCLTDGYMKVLNSCCLDSNPSDYMDLLAKEHLLIKKPPPSILKDFLKDKCSQFIQLEEFNDGEVLGIMERAESVPVDYTKFLSQYMVEIGAKLLFAGKILHMIEKIS